MFKSIRQGCEKLLSRFISATWMTMRATLIATLLLATLLSACTTRIDNKNIDQTSTLKVNPDLLGGSAAPGASKTEPTPARK